MNDILDIEEPEEAEEREIREAASLPGADFASVFGPKLYSRARSILGTLASTYEWDDRDRAAAWPAILVGQIRGYMNHPIAGKLDGHPIPAIVEREFKKAKDFELAWEASSGVALRHRSRQDGCEGSPKLSAHQRIERAQSVRPALMEEAKELRDEGVCDYVESAIRLGERFAHGGRDREDRQRKPVKFRGEREVVR